MTLFILRQKSANVLQNYSETVIQEIQEIFVIRKQATERLLAIKRKLEEKYNTSLRGFDPLTHRILILSRLTDLMGIKFRNLDLFSLDLGVTPIFSEDTRKRIEFYPRIKAYSFSALPMVHAARVSHLDEASYRSMRAMVMLIRSERKCSGRVSRSLQVIAAQYCIKYNDFLMAHDLVRTGLRDLGYDSGIQARSLSAVPYQLLLMKLHLLKGEVSLYNLQISQALFYARYISKIIFFFFRDAHPIIASVNQLLARYFKQTLQRDLNPALKSLFTTYMVYSDIYGRFALITANKLFKVQKMSLIQALYQKEVHFFSQASTDTLNSSCVGFAQSTPEQLPHQFTKIYQQLKIILSIAKKVPQVVLRPKAAQLEVATLIECAQCLLETKKEANVIQAKHHLKTASKIIRLKKKFGQKSLENLYQMKIMKKSVYISFLQFLCTLWLKQIDSAVKHAQELFILLVKLDLAKLNPNKFCFDNYSFGYSQDQEGSLQEDVIRLQIQPLKPKELGMRFNLKGKYMLALVCLALHLSKERDAGSFKFEYARGSLGRSVKENESFFSKFSFTFLRLESETNRLLEQLFQRGKQADISMLEYMLRGGLFRHKNRVVELLDVFKVQEV